MMKKPKKSPLGIIKIAMLIPAVLITLGLTTGMTPQQKTIKGKVTLADSGKPATGAAVLIRNTTMGSVVDIDGTFKLNVDGDPELVISYVGYKTKLIKASDVGNKPILLDQETVQVNLEASALDVKKDASGAITVRLKDGSDVQPVYVVDGKVVKEIDNMDPESIDHISVIKDPDSKLAKKYNAKHGLIMVTTKEGAELLSPKESKKIVDEAGTNDDEPIFYIVEDMPKFPGGKDALKTFVYSKLEYPASAKSKGIEGEVHVRFLVDENGKVRKEEVVRSSYEEFNEPALKVIREMPDWKPGSQRGKPVKVWHVMAINFTIPKK